MSIAPEITSPINAETDPISIDMKPANIDPPVPTRVKTIPQVGEISKPISPDVPIMIKARIRPRIPRTATPNVSIPFANVKDDSTEWKAPFNDHIKLLFW
jgi:hypothetical protein